MYLSILRHFPPVNYALAYGSAVLRQPGLYAAAADPDDTSARAQSGAYASTSLGAHGGGPMLDFIFAVQDPVEWHSRVGAPVTIMHAHTRGRQHGPP